MLTLLTLLTASDDGFRCPDTRRLISVGDDTMLVRQRCRDPNDRTTRTEQRTRSIWNGVFWVQQTYQVEVEEWLYDFGSHDFIRQLRFENGRLRYVATAGYGKD